MFLKTGCSSIGTHPFLFFDERNDIQNAIRAAKEQVLPALVFLMTLREEYRGGEKISVENAGSGVLISPDGEVITNWHVVNKATEIRALLYDGTNCGAELIGSDKESDLALLKLKLPENSAQLPYAEFGDSSKLKE